MSKDKKLIYVSIIITIIIIFVILYLLYNYVKNKNTNKKTNEKFDAGATGAKFLYKACFIDNAERVLPNTPNKVVTTADECYKFAATNDYDVFGLQAGGQCWAGNRNINQYDKYGITDCANALGDRWSNQIYIIPKTADINAPRNATELGVPGIAPWGVCNISKNKTLTWAPGTKWIGANDRWVEATALGKTYFSKKINLDQNKFNNLIGADLYIMVDNYGSVILNNVQVSPSKIVEGEERGLGGGWGLKKTAMYVQIDKSKFKLGENKFYFMVLTSGTIPNPGGLLANIIIKYNNNIPSDIIKTDATFTYNGLASQIGCKEYTDNGENSAPCNNYLINDCYYINTICREKTYFNSNIKDVDKNNIKTFIYPTFDSNTSTISTSTTSPNPTSPNLPANTTKKNYSMVIQIGLDSSQSKTLTTKVTPENILIKGLFLCNMKDLERPCENVLSNNGNNNKNTMRTFNNVNNILSPQPIITQEQYNMVQRNRVMTLLDINNTMLVVPIFNDTPLITNSNSVDVINKIVDSQDTTSVNLYSTTSELTVPMSPLP